MFDSGGRGLIVKISPHRDDLLADVRAAQWRKVGLPTPRVVASGEAFGLGFVVMDRCARHALEASGEAEWTQLIPEVVDLLEALRCADVSGSQEWGGWGPDGNGTHKSWGDFLASAAQPPQRIGAWEPSLRDHSDVFDAFRRGCAVLTAPGVEPPRSLVHCDLLYGNVHADGGRITGVFDWGCALYGDHLIDRSWFEFWAPWYPAFRYHDPDMALRSRWSDIGFELVHEQERRRRSLLWIGVTHFAWNASQHDEENLLGTYNQMRSLDVI